MISAELSPKKGEITPIFEKNKKNKEILKKSIDKTGFFCYNDLVSYDMERCLSG